MDTTYIAAIASVRVSRPLLVISTFTIHPVLFDVVNVTFVYLALLVYLLFKFVFFIYIYIYIYIYICVCVTCSNEMSRMSANLISRKHHINMQR